MLDQLGTVHVSHEHWRHEWFVNFFHQIDGMFALRTDYDPVWIHQICDRAAFAQELGIADDIELRAMAIVALDRLGDFFARLYRHGALVHDHAIVFQDPGNFARDFFDEAQINATIRLLWRG